MPKYLSEEWHKEFQRLWNEQYAIEAFLTMNPSFEVVLGNNHVWHVARADIEAACVPLDGQQPGASFYIRRIG